MADPDALLDPDALIEDLTARGAQRLDPVGFRFVEALARRSSARRGAARRVLDRRLAVHLSRFDERLQHARNQARPEVRGADRPLAELLAYIAQQAADATTAEFAHGADSAAEPLVELKSLHYFRSTWSRLSVDRQISDALAHAPVNGGPLNSHFLVLRSLELMREISPQYLAQFLSYADALLWLDQATSGDGPAQKISSGSETGRKRKPARTSGKSARASDG